jgi:hypothetical protein
MSRFLQHFQHLKLKRAVLVKGHRCTTRRFVSTSRVFNCLRVDKITTILKNISLLLIKGLFSGLSITELLIQIKIRNKQ